jgi:hypothetical protein
MYRWDSRYKLSSWPLIKNSGKRVLEQIQNFANDMKMPEHTWFNTEVLTVREGDSTAKGR